MWVPFSQVYSSLYNAQPPNVPSPLTISINMEEFSLCSFDKYDHFPRINIPRLFIQHCSPFQPCQVEIIQKTLSSVAPFSQMNNFPKRITLHGCVDILNTSLLIFIFTYSYMKQTLKKVFRFRIRVFNGKTLFKVSRVQIINKPKKVCLRVCLREQSSSKT